MRDTSELDFRPSLLGRAWDPEETKRALDELFYVARIYNRSDEYIGLLDFVAKFRFYSPFNAMLIHIQMPGAVYVAPASRWMAQWHRAVKPGERPLVLLRPMGPVMFVFDVSQTVPLDDECPLPEEVVNPFVIRQGWVGNQLELTIENAKRDGVRVVEQGAGSQWAGAIRPAVDPRPLDVTVRQRQGQKVQFVPARYEILLNSGFGREETYATLVHELGHLYCGHLGTPDPSWWPDRSFLGKLEREFEAESVSFLVCSRLGIVTPSARYLARYLERHQEIPPISLDRVLAAAGLIEDMGRGLLKPREKPEGARTVPRR